MGEDGDVYSWGRGWDGQLGHEVVTEIELEPRLVRSMEKLSCATIACGMSHTVAVTDTGNVWCWGDNKAGQLGNGSLTSSSVPVPVTALQEMEVVQVKMNRNYNSEHLHHSSVCRRLLVEMSILLP